MQTSNTEFSVDQKRKFLVMIGFNVGPRDPRLNTNYPGAFMVAEEHDESELPTEDGSNGPWCIVGDDLDALITEAFNVWGDDQGAFGPTPAALLNMSAEEAKRRAILPER